jgi:monoamine oxidase
MPTLYTALKARHTATPKTALDTQLSYVASIKEVEEVERSAIPHAEQISLLNRFVIKPFQNKRPHIVVVGAGLAGLAAAYELKSVGYQVTVFEAQNRVGGRVKSLRNWIANKVVEAGGELIGKNHLAWRSYAAKFGLAFLKASKGTPSDPIFLKGMLLTEQQCQSLAKELDVAVGILNREARRIPNPYAPWTAPNARASDGLSLAKRLQSLPVSLLCILSLDEQFEGDNGVRTDSQSYLGVLAMIRGGNCKRPNGGNYSYWDDTETHRCEGGNVRLAEEFSKQLDSNELRYNQVVREINTNDKAVRVTLDSGDSVEGDDVILAVPPSVWSDITFRPGLRPARRFRPPFCCPQMGKNVKFLMAFNARFWPSQEGPGFSSDGPINLVWESSENQVGSEVALAAFSGGDDAEACERWEASERQSHYLYELCRAHRNAEKAFVKGEFEDWPTAEWTKASYSFPRPGEIMKWGRFLDVGQGRLHFAGEDTCYAFIGYMEGALQSGLRVAEKLARRDGRLARIIRSRVTKP